MIKRILKENLLYILLIVIAIIVFIIVKNTSLSLFIKNIDLKTIEFLKPFYTSNTFFIMVCFTYYGDWYIPALVIILLLLFFKNKKYVYILMFNYGFVGALNFFTKVLIARPRPTLALISIPRSFSFPSGHTMTSIAFYITFCYLFTNTCSLKRKKIYFTIFSFIVLLISFSRIYLGVHYLSDVLCGIILGTLATIMVIRIIDKEFKEKLK